MDADLVENLNDWKCGPRVVGGGDQTVVDGCGDLAVGCHRKSTFKVILADTYLRLLFAYLWSQRTAG